MRKKFAMDASRAWVDGLLIALVAALAIACQADFVSPPRYDGAGYAVLASALVDGQGYRAVDHPDRPRHAHFPPGYPAFLALVWSATGPSVFAAHLASGLCTLGATLAAWGWFRTMYSRPVALALGLALAGNWIWSRTGAGIQSEPLFEWLGQHAILIAVCRWPRRDVLRGVLLGVLLGAALLTRHIALGLIAAVFIDQALRTRWRLLAATAAVVGLIAAPWVFWVASVGRIGQTQAALLVRGGRGVFATFADQALFYLERIPDQLTGPVVEAATVFGRSPAFKGAIVVWAVLASCLIFAGWIAALTNPRRRLAGLIPITTLCLLMVWPYTEAGRFLISLIPCLLVGAVEGLARVVKLARRWIGGSLSSWPSRRFRVVAAWLVLCGSLPYSGYALMTADRRLRGEESRAFDSACQWIKEKADRDGSILTRHPGEVYLRTNRQALEVETSERPGAVDADPSAVAQVIARYNPAYLLIDDSRYANAAASPLDRFVKERPESVRQVMSARDRNGSVRVFEVLR